MRPIYTFLACFVFVSTSLANPTISQVFSFSCDANFTSCPYGMDPTLAPIQLADGNFYGVTWWAGQGSSNNGGTVWRVSPTGEAKAIHTFMINKTGQFPKGENPVIGFAQGADHNLYGITESGGRSNQGVMYKLVPTGGFKIEHNFCTGACTDIQGAIILGKMAIFMESSLRAEPSSASRPKAHTACFTNWTQPKTGLPARSCKDPMGIFMARGRSARPAIVSQRSSGLLPAGNSRTWPPFRRSQEAAEISSRPRTGISMAPMNTMPSAQFFA